MKAVRSCGTFGMIPFSCAENEYFDLDWTQVIVMMCINAKPGSAPDMQCWNTR